MCGIYATRLNQVSPLKQLEKLESRGPDEMKASLLGNWWLGFVHLSINGGKEGMQPASYEDVHIICNGEIYNYKELASEYDIPIFKGSSDCTILPALYKKVGNPTNFFKLLDGVFAMIIVDGDTVIAARDPFGVRPLFYSRDHSEYASLAKAMVSEDVVQFPPGHYFMHGAFTPYHSLHYVKQPYFKYEENAAAALKYALTESVKKRMLSDRPIGALLSGGLDSSIIVSILARESKTRVRTFSIGLKDSPDLKWARVVANYLNTDHTEVVITKKEYLDAIPKVIYDLESYDTTTVRASVGNWLIGKYIRMNTDIKVVFNGDGSDEIGGGYRYFQRAPSNIEFDDECSRLLKDISYFDVLRSDRSISSHGLEPRTPYLDKQVVATWMSMPTSVRRTPLEKYILRKAFEGYLPREALYRKKEAFSDGMSQNAPWSEIKNEEDYYKEIYTKFFGEKQLVPYRWMPRWSPETNDPSARTLDIY